MSLTSKKNLPMGMQNNLMSKGKTKLFCLPRWQIILLLKGKTRMILAYYSSKQYIRFCLPKKMLPDIRIFRYLFGLETRHFLQRSLRENHPEYPRKHLLWPIWTSKATCTGQTVQCIYLQKFN